MHTCVDYVKKLIQNTINLGFEISDWIKIETRNSDQQGEYP